MSRVGKLPVKVPETVEVRLNNRQLTRGSDYNVDFVGNVTFVGNVAQEGAHLLGAAAVDEDQLRVVRPEDLRHLLRRDQADVLARPGEREGTL